MSDESLPPDEVTALEQQATKGRRLLVISSDEDGNLEMEENTFQGWALAGISAWLEIVAESSMFEELTEETEQEDD